MLSTQHVWGRRYERFSHSETRVTPVMLTAMWPPFTDEEVGAAQVEEPGEAPDGFPGSPGSEAHSSGHYQRIPSFAETESEGRNAARVSQCIFQLCELDGPGG